MALVFRPARAFAGLAMLLTTACSSPTTEPGPVAATAGDREPVRVRACTNAEPATSLPANVAALLPPAPDPASRHYTIDDRWAALARRVPGGFAGVMYDVHGVRPVLMLVDPSRAAEAKAALTVQIPDFDVAAAEVRAVRWDFAQLYDWRRYLGSRGFWVSHPGITTSDLDEGANRVSFGTVDQAARDRLVNELAALDLPCDLVVVGVTGIITLLQAPGR